MYPFNNKSEDIYCPYALVKKQNVEKFSIIDKVGDFFTITPITDSIYLSGFTGASNKSLFDKYNIKSVINCSKNISNYFEDNNIVYLRVPIDDISGQHIENYFSTTFDFIDLSIRNNKNILVHCHAGMSRSVTILIAYFMKKNNWDYNTSYNFIKSKRTIANPNNDFINSLKNYDFKG